MKNGIKQYFDEPQEIIGWIIGALGLALAIVALVVDVVPTAEVMPIAGAIILAGVGMVAKALTKYAKLLVDVLGRIADALEKQNADKDSEE